MNQQPRFTALGKIVSILLVAGLVTLGVYMLRGRFGGSGGEGGTAPGAESAAGSGAAPEVQEVKVEVPKLSPPAAFQFKDNIVPIEISEYAGYAGLIAANGGLDPTENSLFFKNHGFKVKLTISEDETWSELNEGKIAASVTTVDVLAAYGRRFEIVIRSSSDPKAAMDEMAAAAKSAGLIDSASWPPRSDLAKFLSYLWNDNPLVPDRLNLSRDTIPRPRDVKDLATALDVLQ